MAQIYHDIHVASAPAIDKVQIKSLDISSRTVSATTSIRAALTLGLASTYYVIGNFQAHLYEGQSNTIIEYARIWHEEDSPRNEPDAILKPFMLDPDDQHRNEYLARTIRCQCQRYGEFARQHGIMMLCILAPSMAFRAACSSSNDRDWASLRTIPTENSESLEIFAKARSLDWTAAFEYINIHPSSRLSRMPLMERWPYFHFNHPHEVVVLDAPHQPIRLPRFEGYARTNIIQSTYRSEDFIGLDRPSDSLHNEAYPPIRIYEAAKGAM